MSIQALTQDSNEEQNYRWSGWKKVGQNDLKLWHVDDTVSQLLLYVALCWLRWLASV